MEILDEVDDKQQEKSLSNTKGESSQDEIEEESSIKLIVVAVVILAILMSGIFTGITCLIIKRKQAHKKVHITQESIEETPRGYLDLGIDTKDLNIKSETPR